MKEGAKLTYSLWSHINSIRAFWDAVYNVIEKRDEQSIKELEDRYDEMKLEGSLSSK